MNPCPLDGTDQLARHVLAACIEPDGPVDADGEHALVIDDARHPAFLSGGEAARPWDAATGALVRRPRRRRCSWQRLVAHLSHDPDVAWRVNGLADPQGLRLVQGRDDAASPRRRSPLPSAQTLARRPPSPATVRPPLVRLASIQYDAGRSRSSRRRSMRARRRTARRRSNHRAAGPRARARTLRPGDSIARPAPASTCSQGVHTRTYCRKERFCNPPAPDPISAG